MDFAGGGRTKIKVYREEIKLCTVDENIVNHDTSVGLLTLPDFLVAISSGSSVASLSAALSAATSSGLSFGLKGGGVGLWWLWFNCREGRRDASDENMELERKTKGGMIHVLYDRVTIPVCTSFVVV